METGNSYLLILRNAVENPWFVPVGVNIGKIPEDVSEDIIYNDGTDTAAEENIADIISEVREEYDF